jgi:hypothetical protein
VVSHRSAASSLLLWPTGCMGKGSGPTDLCFAAQVSPTHTTSSAAAAAALAASIDRIHAARLVHARARKALCCKWLLWLPVRVCGGRDGCGVVSKDAHLFYFSPKQQQTPDASSLHYSMLPPCFPSQSIDRPAAAARGHCIDQCHRGLNRFDRLTAARHMLPARAQVPKGGRMNHSFHTLASLIPLPWPRASQGARVVTRSRDRGGGGDRRDVFASI